MEFMKCSVGEEAYGRGYTEAQVTTAKRNGQPISVDNSAPLPNADPNFAFKDERFLADLHQGSEQSEKIRNFLRLLSVCHTVVPERDYRSKESDASNSEQQLVKIGEKIYWRVFQVL